MAATQKRGAEVRRHKHPGRGRARRGEGTEVRASDKAAAPGEPMVTSASTQAPANAAADPAAQQSDENLEAFFSSGPGPALHYDRSGSALPGTVAQGGQEAAGP